MPGPARAGALVYAKALDRLSAFYQQVLGMRLLAADGHHHVIESADLQLVIHAIPPHIAADIALTTPPQVREDQAIKLFFTVASLATAQAQIEALGGGVFGPVYPGPGFQARNAFDCEGNVFHLRAPSA
jgi:predicted enzyme related to lactoylglutathione lyase